MKPRLLILVAMLIGTALAEEKWIPLWDGAAPGAPQPPAGTESVNEKNWVTDVERPEYLLYLAPEEKRTGQGVVIFPGGGYAFVSVNNEGHDYAKWLNERGITAIIVKYRATDTPQLGYRFPVPFLDARRAIRTMRAKADEWGVDPDKVGVMGSSAGGHLASLCATRFADEFPEEGRDGIDALDCRPDFAVMLYPVISLKPDLLHQGSADRLTGGDEELIAKLSTQDHVRADTPPCFLVTTGDDFVDCRNSLLFAAACKAAGVPVSLHLFESGGHGYGLHGEGDLATWPELLEAWLK